MPKYPGIQDGIIIEDVGGGNPVSIPSVMVAELGGGSSPEQRTILAGSVDVRARHNWLANIRDFQYFSALQTDAAAGTQKRITHVHAGTTNDQWEPAIIGVSPNFPVANFCKIHYAAAGTVETTPTSNPTTDAVNWTDLGDVAGGSSLTFPRSEPGDGCGRLQYHSSRINFDGRLLNSPATDIAATLDTINRLNVDIAIEHADGTYLVFKDVPISSAYDPVYSDSDFLYYSFNFTRRYFNLTDVIVLPATTPIDFYSFELSYSLSGVVESDYLQKV